MNFDDKIKNMLGKTNTPTVNTKNISRKPTNKRKFVGMYTNEFQMRKFKEGQQYPYVIDTKTKRKVERIKFGNEPQKRGDKYCHDCGVPKGYYHWKNCDIEICPITGGQLLMSERVGDYSK